MVSRDNPMTDEQCMDALLNHRKPDHVLHWGYVPWGFGTLYVGGSIADAYNNPEVCYAGQRKVAQDFKWVFAPIMLYTNGAWEFGGEIEWPTSEFSQSPSAVRRAVDTPEEAMNLRMPDVKNAGAVPIWMEFCKLSASEKLDNEPFNVTFPFDGPFTMAAEICGPEKLARWLIKKPEAAHYLLRLATDFLIEFAQYWVDTFGTENLLAFNAEPTTSNQIISPRMFKEFALPYLKELHEKMLTMGYKTIFCHICGEQNLNLPYWAEVPMGNPGIISIGYEIELETAAEYFPNDIIYGNLDPSILMVETPEGVYEATKRVVEKGKKLPTGFIFGPGCEMPPRTSPDNIRAMCQAVNDFGWY